MKKGFIDETPITADGGDGGNGIVSFLRERARPLGGPNGGDGGDGGSVCMVADGGIKTLLTLARRRRIVAGKGKRGDGGNRHGGAGEDVIVRAPVGTRVSDADTGCLHADLVREGDEVVLARGGRGGLGNTRFKSSTNRAPRHCTAGESGESRYFNLELRVLADVGLLGLPNAGKSSLLRAMSAAKPKVASYPFTTLSPQLGVIDADDGTAVTIADVPGLICGSAAGAGLGNRFLRHLARTALLCHVVDMAAADPATDCRAVEAELRASDLPLFGKPRWLVMNKSDLLSAEAQSACCREMRRLFPHFVHVHAVSALAGTGTREFCQKLLAHYADVAG